MDLLHAIIVFGKVFNSNYCYNEALLYSIFIIQSPQWKNNKRSRAYPIIKAGMTAAFYDRLIKMFDKKKK